MGPVSTRRRRRRRRKRVRPGQMGWRRRAYAALRARAEAGESELPPRRHGERAASYQDDSRRSETPTRTMFEIAGKKVLSREPPASATAVTARARRAAPPFPAPHGAGRLGFAWERLLAALQSAIFRPGLGRRAGHERIEALLRPAARSVAGRGQATTRGWPACESAFLCLTWKPRALKRPLSGCNSDTHGKWTARLPHAGGRFKRA